ncbi:phage terminase small subunit [Glaciimonas sp. CA11.2]|uniref:phage terminase small subunit n=1 Tax=Glaciimonas sp. CA11.2 TaxID=3048601 RepID=UPI002AB4AF85|nr:phage terminase small subunit [Glaciimonas sp. CA11.2]MDY7547281.1 phage terminase small subunit [Glaciimonas sp. CA11.2]MEB0162736.1 phage terminase small subunit [Glaciimonas sp. CA11.2]
MGDLSPALRHKARALAAKAAANAPEGHLTAGSAYELMLYKLAEDRRRLKQIQSVKQKIALKAEILPEYQDWIDGVLSAGKGAQDDVLTTLLVWHIDVGDYAQALRIAAYAITHALTLPDQYNRDIPTMLMDEFAEAMLSGQMTPAIGRTILPLVITLTESRDAPDQARAKLHKGLAYALLDKSAIAADNVADAAPAAIHLALPHLTRALALDSRVGVKKDIERLTCRLKKTTATLAKGKA